MITLRLGGKPGVAIEPPAVNSGNEYDAARVIGSMRNIVQHAYRGEHLQPRLDFLVEDAEGALKFAESHLLDKQTPRHEVWKYILPIEERMQDLMRHGREGELYANVCIAAMSDLIRKSPNFD